jgi:hypothetical protein
MAHGKCGEGFVYEVYFCGLSIIVVCCMCTCRYIPGEWNIGFDRMDAGLGDSAFELGVLSRRR